jgi:Gas vesicle synthesis protein GvpL/GvpF
LACLLYCVTLKSAESLSNLIGVAEQPVLAHDSAELRAYWSEVANPETLVAGASRKPAEVKYQQVLRETATRATAIAFPFPALVPDPESLEAAVAQQREYYVEALTRLAGTIQYELTSTWAKDEHADLATPITGKEYLKRRAESEAHIATIDAKLKTVTAGIVRDWRSRQDRRKHLWFALIAHEDRERFIAALRSAGPSEGVRLRLSGPWPPNEFVPEQQ